jgi:hypothetical protein
MGETCSTKKRDAYNIRGSGLVYMQLIYAASRAGVQHLTGANVISNDHSALYERNRYQVSLTF